ncbi:class II aldolase [Caldicellulosiruptor changbaiensis]|uniref:Class II aldolase n=1 Tax=Caldicellulosiruptor changbaiensis TaxID=1222016 RepID=A0A3T0D7T5_9FIRM|nr:class II aldolase/adducin family protein [Caldicellulosiruptor changbaiensis]AZT91048.1 class II aldolase [Caldicellulosiruptor changbaiensis]
MKSKGLLELVRMCQRIGKRIDYVQGGGGNISVKLDSTLMAIKASGFRLSQVTKQEGYVIVDYSKIKNYYDNVDTSGGYDFEKESVDVAIKSIVWPTENVLRPSVEVGFHSVLDKYVIHSHSVYANILACSYEGKEIVQKVLSEEGINLIWIPYINPGFWLTLEIKKRISTLDEKDKEKSKILIMENHGLIISSNVYKEALEIHEKVNNLIKKRLGIKGRYPTVKLEKIDEKKYKSRTRFIYDFIASKNVTPVFFEKYSLYPDQLVYINSNLYADDSKIEINAKSKEVTYNTTYSEALAIEETLLAYFYVIEQIEKLGLTIKTMTEDSTNYIKNWESEEYRKKLIKEMTK